MSKDQNQGGKMDQDFEGIWIPKELWFDENLTMQEKLFYARIKSLDNKNGCFANNQYFANFFNISKTRCSLVITSLIKKGYVTSTIIHKEGTKQILKRVLNISYTPPLIKVKEGHKQKLNTPIQQKLKDSNRSNSNRISNRIENKENEVFSKIPNLKKQIGKTHYEQLNAIAQKEEIYLRLKALWPSGKFHVLCQWLEYRNEAKKNLTGRGIKMLLTKFEKFTPTELEDAVGTSIENNYTGLFPKKNIQERKGIQQKIENNLSVIFKPGASV